MITDVYSGLAGFLLAVLATGGGAAVVAFYLFKWLGEKWLTTKFDERLAAYKHAQQLELEGWKFKINTLMDRTTKLHQREFETLPEVWAKLVLAFNHTRAHTSALQSTPNLDFMPDNLLQSFIEQCDLEDWQKKELSQTEDKTEYYRKAIYWHKLDKCKGLIRGYHVDLLKYGIFMPDDIQAKFTSLNDLMWAAVEEHSLNEREPIIPRLKAAKDKFDESAEKIMQEIEKQIKKRLSHITLEPSPSENSQ